MWHSQEVDSNRKSERGICTIQIASHGWRARLSLPLRSPSFPTIVTRNASFAAIHRPPPSLHLRLFFFRSLSSESWGPNNQNHGGFLRVPCSRTFLLCLLKPHYFSLRWCWYLSQTGMEVKWILIGCNYKSILMGSDYLLCGFGYLDWGAFYFLGFSSPIGYQDSLHWEGCIGTKAWTLSIRLIVYLTQIYI